MILSIEPRLRAITAARPARDIHERRLTQGEMNEELLMITDKLRVQ
jgi:hypothetical protein